MKFLANLFLIIASLIFFTGCPDNTTDPVTDQFKGYIYYSSFESTSNIYRIDLKTEKSQKLFNNCRYPDLTKNGNILSVEQFPHRLILSDLTGANKISILDGTDYLGPIHRRSIENPRVSYDQKYIAYDGGSGTNPVTFVIDANTSDLVLIVGDYNNKPYIRPSWSPDGSLFVSGINSKNNGIYKISSDFQTIVRIDPDLTNVSYPSVSPDGNYIAFVKDDNIWTMEIDGSNPQQHYISDLKFFVPTWSPDSKYLVATSTGNGGSAYIFDLENDTYHQLTNAGRINQFEQLKWVY